MTTDSPERWRQISVLFDEAVKLPPERRAAFLHNACGGDADLRGRVEALLKAAGQTDDFLERPLISPSDAALRHLVDGATERPDAPPHDSPSSAPTDTDAPGVEAAEAFGPYRLQQKIGEGGMGEVWLAEQAEPIRRQVALKVIKAGMDTKQVIARFEAERQALALMDHPAIAKVFDAGETPRGLPFFVMEHVKGEPITTYCDRQRLTNAQRLELFERVCDGVQHAHQKGVIHRDLKPSNVLVTIQDEKPVPKIIDFGVAKAIAQRLTERTLFTELGVLVGTPEYMSPEQAEMTGLDVDTRSDVYALGIILYELLAGALPFDPGELRKAGFDEIRRRIREVDPPRPSTRISTMGKASGESARNRGTDPVRLAGQLRGDLDWITMKALEKDRTRRYGSPSEMAADIARHLRNEPVLAGPPSATYRAGKFMRRHRFGVAIATLGVLALAGFSVTMAFQARRIAVQRNRAERVSGFLTDLFNVSDPGQARGNAVTAREILDKGSERIDKELANEPEVQAQMMLTIGWVYAKLGLYPKAEPLLKRSIEIRTRILGEHEPETLTALEDLAFVYEREGRYAEAEEIGNVTVRERRRVLGEEHPDTLNSMQRLSVVYGREGRDAEAHQLAAKVLEVRRRVLPENDNATVWSMQDVANDYRLMGRYQEAEKLFREALEIRRKTLGTDHPDTLWIMNNLGLVLMSQGKYGEAEKLFRQTFEGRMKVLGADHLDTCVSLSNLGSIYEQQGLYAKAERTYRQAYERIRRASPEDPADFWEIKSRIASAASAQGHFKEAKRIYLELLEARRRALGPENPHTMAIVNNLAVVLDEQKYYPEAEKLFRQVLDVDRRILGPDHVNTLIAINNVGAVCAEQKHFDEAERLLREALQGESRVLGPRHPNTLGTQIGLAGLAGFRGLRAQALELVRQAVDAGYDDVEELSKEPGLKPLHGDPEYERLVAAVRENARKRN